MADLFADGIDPAPGVSAYAVGDVHGCLDELRAALYRGGFVGGRGQWIAGDAHLWFLGDLTDRGPDGVGVIDLVMALQEQAAEAGGEVGCLLGNHELMLFTAHLPGARVLRLVDPDAEPDHHALFRERWYGNGGKSADSTRLTGEHLAWIADLPAMAQVGGHLLVHADTQAYLELGETVHEVNEAVTKAMHTPADVAELDRLTHLLTKRFAFASDDGAAAREFLQVFGGRQIVHGHSPIPLLMGIEPTAVTGPLVYAGGYAVNLDTGTFLGGPCFVSALPSVPAVLP
jgi:Calcineurin-like phosphoesterase